MSRLFELVLALLGRRSPKSRALELWGEDARGMPGRGDGHKPGDIDPKYLPEVLEGLAQARRHQFAPEAKIETSLRRFEE